MNPEAFCVVCITDLGGGAGLGNAPFKDVKDAITAHTLAGHVDEALSAFMVLINKHRDAVEPRDVYQGVFPLVSMLYASESDNVYATDIGEGACTIRVPCSKAYWGMCLLFVRCTARQERW
jgi:hypothetical protein